VDLTIARAPYLQIADKLRARIEAGEYTDRLPTLGDLMDEISPRPGYNTVRKAVEVLKKEGLVETSPRGTFLRREGTQ
jgi:DNA-binding GntR family transcriptional regulator